MSQPFARAIAMTTAIAVAMRLTGIARQNILQSIEPYESRGHGLGKLGKSYLQNRSKYVPHYGAKESAKFCAAK